MLKHLIDVDFLEGYCTLELHVNMVSHGVKVFFVAIFNTGQLSFSDPLRISLLLNVFNGVRLLGRGSLLSSFPSLLFDPHGPFFHWRDLDFSIFLHLFGYVHEHQLALLHVLIIINVNLHIELECLTALKVLHCLALLVFEIIDCNICAQTNGLAL